jgi:hypothetical protein
MRSGTGFELDDLRMQKLLNARAGAESKTIIIEKN